VLLVVDDHDPGAQRRAHRIKFITATSKGRFTNVSEM